VGNGLAVAVGVSGVLLAEAAMKQQNKKKTSPLPKIADLFLLDPFLLLLSLLALACQLVSSRACNIGTQ